MNDHSSSHKPDSDKRADEEQLISAELNTDDSIPGLSDVEAGQSDDMVTRLQSEHNETKDKYIRLVAEFDNYKKRNAKERLDLIQTANRETIQALLDVLDDIDRASRQIEQSKDVDQIKEGIGLVFSKFRNTMMQKGVKIMDSQRQDFDPELHEAITEIPAPDDMKGKVMDVVQPGYYLNDKLIRHAKVVVGK